MNCINSYQFLDLDRCFGHNRRIQITTSSGDVYNIAAEDNPDNIWLPNFIKKIFWAKVSLSNELGESQTFLINKNSLTKHTHSTSSFARKTLFQHKKDKNLDSIFVTLSKVDRLARAMKGDVAFSYKRSRIASNSVKIIEKYGHRLADGPILIEKKGLCIFENRNPKTGAAEFYIQLEKQIGYGSFKTVHSLLNYQSEQADHALSVQKSNAKMLSHMKYSKIGFDFLQQFEDVKEILKPKFYYEKGVMRDENGKFLSATAEAIAYLVSKRFEGTLKDCLNADLPLKEKLNIFLQIFKGVEGMHKKDIVHCDLKPANILIKWKDNAYKIKIIDLDLSCTFAERQNIKSNRGSPIYIAPEAFLEKEIADPSKLDSWSLGLILYQLFEDPKLLKEFKLIKNNKDRALSFKSLFKKLSFNKLNTLPDQSPIIPLIQGLLAVNPAERFSIAQAIESVEVLINNL